MLDKLGFVNSKVADKKDINNSVRRK